MKAFLAAFLHSILLTLGSKRDVLSKNAVLKKENEILLRKVGKQRVQFDTLDKSFFNSQRPHQGIRQQIPKHAELEKRGGAVCRSAVLGGLHHHYFRRAA
jgi:hypothetical protein